MQMWFLRDTKVGWLEMDYLILHNVLLQSHASQLQWACGEMLVKVSVMFSCYLHKGFGGRFHLHWRRNKVFDKALNFFLTLL